MNTKIKGGLKMVIAKSSFTSYVWKATKDFWMLILWVCYFTQLTLNIISFVSTKQIDKELIVENICFLAAIILVILFAAYVDYKNSIQRIGGCYNIKFYLQCMTKIDENTIRVNAFNKCLFPINQTICLLKELQSLHLFVYEYPFGYCFEKNFFSNYEMYSVIIDNLTDIELLQLHRKNGKTYYAIPSRNDFDFFATAFQQTAL